MMKLIERSPAALTAILWLLAGCGDATGPVDPITELPRDLTVAEQTLIESSNAFSFHLLAEVAGAGAPGENVFLSPFSVSMALGMALNGAAGTTFDAMRTTLGFEGLSQVEINESYRDLTQLLLDLDDRVELDIANSTWARLGYPVKQSFFAAVRDYFDAEARELDFTSPGAKDVINGWVSENTHGRIEEIVQQITADDILFLINAVYFKGDWTYQFSRDDTRPLAFELEDGSSVQVPTMSGDLEVGTFYDPDLGVEGGELTYSRQAFSMVVVMPPRGGSVDGLVQSLDDATWQGWMEGIHYGEMPVRLPKLELEYEASLGEPLIAMGMGEAFDPDRADFSNLTEAQRAFISRVRHKTFLLVDEEGTEAAAATSVAVGVTSAPMGLFVDRPFVLAIRERLSGTILFLGIVRDPR